MFSRKLLPAPLGIGLLARSQLYEIKAGFRRSSLMKKATVFISLVLVMIVFPLVSTGQIVEVTPENPKWGDTIRVTYNPAAEGAVFLESDIVFAVYNVYKKGEASQKSIQMELIGGVFSCDILVEKGNEFLTFYFITLEKMDRKASASILVLMEDGTPPWGANHKMMMNSSKEEYLDYFQEERLLYPKNYAVFRDKWFIMGSYDKENVTQTVQQDMKWLEENVSSKSEELLFALSYGYLFLEKEERENPMPLFILANSLLNKGGDLKKAAEMIDRATEYFIRGKYRFYQDIEGSITQRYLPRCFKLSAEIRIKTGDLSRALSDIKAAQAVLMETRPEYFELEAEIWLELGQLQNAEQALLKSSKLGYSGAEKSMREIYMKRHGSLDGFDSYLTAALKQHLSSKSGDKEVAPDFDVKTLEGEKIRLSDLAGKVVVLNFWFIGCAPCRVEMSGLNELKEELTGKDVVFIAFALDSAEALKKFLETTVFKYLVIPKAGEIAELYGAEAYPTHIIINKKGEIEYRLTGGSPERHKQIRPLINILLR